MLDLEEYAIGRKQESTGNNIPVVLNESNREFAKKIKSIICLSLSDDILSSIINLPTALISLKNSVRNSRESVVDPESGPGRTSGWSMTKGDDPIKSYMAKVQVAAQTVRASGGTIDDQLIIDKLLAGLPEEYDSIIMTLDSLESPATQSELTIAKVIELLQIREGQITCSNTYFQANLAKTRCRLHPNLSHSNEQCYTQHPHLRPADWKPRSSRNVTKDKADSVQSYHFASSASCSTNQSDDSATVWYIDTGYSHYMTCDSSNLFDIKQSFPRPRVELGDNSTIEALGYGKSNIDLRGVQMQLQNVLAVLHLGKFTPWVRQHLLDYVSSSVERN